MVSEYFFRILNNLHQNFPQLIFIIIGDENQLKPVCDNSDSYNYFDNVIIHEITNNNKVVLSKCRRSDDELFRDVQRVREGWNFDGFGYGHEIGWKNICYTNFCRKEVNKLCMDKYLKKMKIKSLLVKANCNCQFKNCKCLSQDIRLYDKLPLIGYKNCKEHNVYNSVDYTVVKWDKDNVKILNNFDGTTNIMQTNQITNFFLPAYCITTHKAQGSTIKGNYSILEWEKMDQTLKYVALSRGERKSNISIVREEQFSTENVREKMKPFFLEF